MGARVLYHAARLRPWLLGAMTALFVARPLYPSEAVYWKGDGLPVVMLWIALAGAWLLGAIGRRRFSLRLGCTDAAVVALVAWHSLAAVWATAHVSPRPAINALWEWIGLGLAYLMARQLIESRREARAVVAVMVALAVALAGYGLYQYFHELPAMRAAYEVDREASMRQAGLYFEPGSSEEQNFENRLNSVEPFATFALTNSLAGYLAPWLVILAGIAVTGGFRGAFRGGLVAVGLTVAACLVLTQSRSAYVATALGVALLWLFAGQWVRRLGWKLPLFGGIAAALLLGAATAVGGLDRAMLTEATKSFGYRIQYWQSSLRMIADRPVVGCGPGNFQNAYAAYKLPEASEEVADPHNFLIEIWATSGTPALLAMLAVLGCFVMRFRYGKNGCHVQACGLLIKGCHCWLVQQCSWNFPGKTLLDKPAVAPDKHENIFFQQTACREHVQRAEPSPHAHGKRGHGTRAENAPATTTATKPSPGNPFSTEGAPMESGEAETDSPGAVYFGAAVGFVLSLGLGFISATSPGVMAVVLGLPLAAGCVALLSGWVARGRLPAWLPTVGVAVLLVNLLAAGGIGFPGVAGSLWLLVALGLHCAEADRPARTLPRGMAVVLLVGACVLGIACHATAYGPVLRCQGNLLAARAAMERSDLDAAEEYLLAAREADPLAVEPWQQLAALALARAQRETTPETFASLLRYLEPYDVALERLAPNSSRAWYEAGKVYEAAHALTGQAAQLDRAVAAFRRATDLYPNNARYWARLALAYRAAGDVEAFRREADRALRLDDLMPHKDRKLEPEERQPLLRPKGDANSGA